MSRNAMCVASVGADGQPSTRIVLLKEISQGGFVFYTNYESRKATELDANPKVAANFLWLPLQRQVNVTGRVERIAKAESLRYFLSRPLGSRLGAWTSPQSQVIRSRQILEAKLEQMKHKFADGAPLGLLGRVSGSCRKRLSSGRVVRAVCMTASCIGK